MTEDRKKTEPQEESSGRGEEFRESLVATERGYSYAERRAEANTMGILMMIAAIWLTVAPFVLSYGDPTATWNDVMLGIIIGLVALAGVFSSPRVSGWINLVAGIWLIIAPFVLSYQGDKAVTAAWNDVILGIIVGVLGLWSIGAGSEPDYE